MHEGIANQYNYSKAINTQIQTTKIKSRENKSKNINITSNPKWSPTKTLLTNEPWHNLNYVVIRLEN